MTDLFDIIRFHVSKSYQIEPLLTINLAFFEGGGRIRVINI